MAWEDVEPGDLIEYQVGRDSKKFGIYLGLHEENDWFSWYVVYKDGVEYISRDPGFTMKVEVRSALKNAKG